MSSGKHVGAVLQDSGMRNSKLTKILLGHLLISSL